MNITLTKTRTSIFEQSRNVLLCLEIALFPWINYSDVLRLVFIFLVVTNVFLSFFISFTTGKFKSLTVIDILLGSIIAISLFNPGSYWQSFSTESVVFRLFVFYLRYLTLPNNFFKKNLNLLYLYFLISAILVLFVWFFQERNLRLVLPYGDPNYLGFIFGSYAVLAMCQAFNGKATKVSILLIILCCYIVLVTASRGSILALALASLFIFIKDIYRFLSVIVILFFVSQIEFVNILLADLFIIERILDPRDSDIGAANVRLIEIVVALGMLGDNLFNAFFGYGASSSSSQFFLSESSTRIHNTYIAIIFEQGILGGAIAFFMVLFMLRKSYQNGLLPLMIFMLLNSMTVFVLTFYHFFVFTKLVQEEKT